MLVLGPKVHLRQFEDPTGHLWIAIVFLSGDDLEDTICCSETWPECHRVSGLSCLARVAKHASSIGQVWADFSATSLGWFALRKLTGPHGGSIAKAEKAANKAGFTLMDTMLGERYCAWGQCLCTCFHVVVCNALAFRLLPSSSSDPVRNSVKWTEDELTRTEEGFGLQGEIQLILPELPPPCGKIWVTADDWLDTRISHMHAWFKQLVVSDADRIVGWGSFPTWHSAWFAYMCMHSRCPRQVGAGRNARTRMLQSLRGRITALPPSSKESLATAQTLPKGDCSQGVLQQIWQGRLSGPLCFQHCWDSGSLWPVQPSNPVFAGQKRKCGKARAGQNYCRVLPRGLFLTTPCQYWWIFVDGTIFRCFFGILVPSSFAFPWFPCFSASPCSFVVSHK